MKLAIGEAQKSIEPVKCGAVIVKNRKVLARTLILKEMIVTRLLMQKLKR